MELRELELPDNLTGLEAKALLLLKAQDYFSNDDLHPNEAVCSQTCQALARMGWPVSEIPRKPEQTKAAYFVPLKFGFRDTGARADMNKLAQERFRSRAFIEWEEEVQAALAGEPVPMRPRKAVDASGEWKAGDYTGLRGARLQHPPMQSHGARVLYALMHLDEALPDVVGFAPMALIPVAKELEAQGWPVRLESQPLRVTWSSEVPKDVIDAWRTSYGNRGRSQALSGMYSTRVEA